MRFEPSGTNCAGSSSIGPLVLGGSASSCGWRGAILLCFVFFAERISLSSTLCHVVEELEGPEGKAFARSNPCGFFHFIAQVRNASACSRLVLVLVIMSGMGRSCCSAHLSHLGSPDSLPIFPFFSFVIDIMEFFTFSELFF
jgi:hypothetical protein